MKINKYIVTSALVSAAFVFVVSSVLAEDGTSSGFTATSEPTIFPSPSTNFNTGREDGRFSFEPFHGKQETPEPSETPRVRGEDRLETGRLKACEEHQDEIDERSTSLVGLVSDMLGKFDGIVKRVEDYYTNKVVPSGKTVANYSDLVNNITKARANVVTILSNSQSDVSGFSCTGTNPKGQLTQFRIDMQAVKAALKDYRTAIKNLIVAVRGVVGESETNETPKPTPSPAPVVTPSPVSTPTASP